jgi:glycine cleavage system aminomethyltransferase T/glycine/D-amino acid oxidase-like deaminating enzyme
MAGEFPNQARVVIVGGGIAGCSLAYHLVKLGWRDVVLLERARLTSGTTWHAAGLVGQMRPNRNMTRMSRYGIELYAKLEAETGQATGWKQCGSVNVARTPERMHAYRRQVALARGFGVEMHLISASEAQQRWPLLRSDDLQGAIWVPHDGKANPADVTQALAKGARQGGARLIEGVRVTGFDIRNGRVCGVHTDHGDIACEVVANCAGQWARQVGALAGVTVPLYAAEHFYIVTEPIAGVTPDLPVMRDPDGFIYYKEEVGGLLMGGFEPVAKPWLETIPENFEFQLLPEDWDQFEILMGNAIHRTPCLETAPVKMLLNGPESFTPDGNFIIGEAPELRNFFVSAGFNSSGIANGGGAGRLLADWIVSGEPPFDVWDVDIRRFGRFHGNVRHLRDRTVESLGLHYAMRWPRQEMVTARPLRRSPLYDRLRDRGAQFGAKMGWERPLYFDLPGAPGPTYGFGRPTWLPRVELEQRAAREAAALFDMSSFAKLLVQGRDSHVLLQQLCANDISGPVGSITYTGLLNARGGYESDLTVMRLADESFLLITGTAQATRDSDWIVRHVGDRFVTLADVTGAWSVLGLMGPFAEAVLGCVSPADMSASGLPSGYFREIDLGYARVRATRMSYVGGSGFELHVPVEFAAHVFECLHEAGRTFGLRDAGYYAIDALRIEAGRRAWGAELGPDETPVEAGLMHAVRLDKGDFIGRSAVLAARQAGVRKRLAIFLVDDPEAWPWGGEGILRDGVPVGEVTSAGWSATHARAVVMGYVRSGETVTERDWVLSGRYTLDIAGAIVPMQVLARAPFRG